MSVIQKNISHLSFQTFSDLGIKSQAVFDKRFQDKKGEFLYRYSLTHEWQGGPKKKLVFLMLNPSTADAFKADPTVARCMVWAQKWGYGTLEVVNLFAFRATKPAAMKKAEDPVGPLNNEFLRDAAAAADLVIAAWGAHGKHQGRGLEVARKVLKVSPLFCLEVIENGHPKHPLYIKGNTVPRPYSLEKTGATA
jgi:hypothetical protein